MSAAYNVNVALILFSNRNAGTVKQKETPYRYSSRTSMYLRHFYNTQRRLDFYLIAVIYFYS